MNEEQIAEKLADLEPAWAGRPNLFEKQIAARDAASLLARLDDPLPGVRAARGSLAQTRSQSSREGKVTSSCDRWSSASAG